MAALAASLLVGSVLLFAAFQLYLIQQAAQPAPQPLALATLIEQGAGNNAHVTVSNYVFARPIIEAQGGSQTIWLPLYVANPRTRQPVRPRVVYRLQAAESALPELLKTATLTALVCDRMPGGGPWDYRLPAQFAERYPSEDAPTTIVLAEPTMRLAGWSLAPDLVFAPTTQLAGWVLGAVLVLVGLGGLLWMGRNDAAVESTAVPAERSAALAKESSLSSHAFNTWEFASRGFKIMVFCGIMLASLCLLFFVGVYLLNSAPDTGYTVMAVSVGLALINLWLLQLHFQYRSHGVASIEVCNSGLRWMKLAGKSTHMASWSEVARCDLNHTSPYPWRHTLTIAFRSGEELRLAAFSLTDYHAFAKFVQDGYRQGVCANDSLAQIGGTVKLSTMSRLSRS